MKEIVEMSENKGVEYMCTALKKLKMLQEKFDLTPSEAEEYLKKV